MIALVVLSDCNDHPLAPLLRRGRRHVWAVVQDVERGHWLSYNFKRGVPQIRCEAAADFDMAQFYRNEGYEVIESEVCDAPSLFPFMLRTCVGLTKHILGIRSWSLTPHQLAQHLIKRARA